MLKEKKVLPPSRQISELTLPLVLRGGNQTETVWCNISAQLQLNQGHLFNRIICIHYQIVCRNMQKCCATIRLHKSDLPSSNPLHRVNTLLWIKQVIHHYRPFPATPTEILQKKLWLFQLTANCGCCCVTACVSYLLYSTMSGTQISWEGTRMDVTLSKSEGLHCSL